MLTTVMLYIVALLVSIAAIVTFAFKLMLLVIFTGIEILRMLAGIATGTLTALPGTVNERLLAIML